MRELAVAIQNENENVNIIQTIESVKNAEFKNVFVQWYDKDWEHSQIEQVEMMQKIRT